MRIVILDGHTENPGDLSWDGFRQLGDLTVYDRTATEALVLERAKGAEVVVVNKTRLTADTIRRLLPELRYIGVLATGYDVVDVQAAGQAGVIVCNIPEYGTDAVAQMTFALLLELCHHVGGHDLSVKRGDWSACEDFSYWNHPLVELANKTMGIVGFGRIGRRVAAIASAFAMNVLAFDEHVDLSLETDRFRYASLGELLEMSDVVSLHCPLTPSTREIINASTIARMKRGVMLVNTARGALIREQDLADALNTGRILGAAVDVVSVEPIRETNPLLSARNCIITPHIAWAPKESRQRLMDTAVANLAAFVAGRPQNIVS